MRKIIYSLFAAVFMLVCSSSFSQTEILIKALDGTTLVNGGSVVTGHTNEIDAFAYSQGLSTCTTCSVTTPSDFTFIMSFNAATVTLKNVMLNHRALTSVDVTFKKTTGGFEYYKMHMENVTVSSEQESGSSDTPSISVSFTPTRIAWQQIAQTQAGGAGKKTSYGWDFTSNTEWLYY